MSWLDAPWLWVLIALPLLGAAWVARLASRARARLRAGLVAVVTLGLALVLAIPSAGLSASAALGDPLRPGGAAPWLALDGLNGPLLALTALVTLASLACASGAEARPAHLARLLVLESATLGVLSSQHLGALTVFWVVGLLPVGGALQTDDPESRGAWRLFLLTQALGAAALVTVVAVLAHSGAQPGWLALAPADWRGSLSALVAGAALLRAGLFPFPSWVLAGSGRLGGATTSLLVTPQVGAYLLARLLALDPDLAQGPVLAGLVLTGAVYAAALALVQTELTRGLACLALSETALVLVGLLAGNPIARTGALLVWLSVGGGLCGLLLAGAAVEARVGRLDLRARGGLGAHAPRLGLKFLLLGLASVGIPGSLGFVSEDLLFHGVLEARPLAGGLIVLVTALNGFTVLRLYLRAFQGPASPEPTQDALPRERLALLILTLLLLLGGVAPAPLVRSRAAVGRALVSAPARR